MANNIIVETILWEDIEIEITYETEKWGSIDHIEIRSISPEKARIPITKTGYRSHFIPIGALEENGITAKELVLEWIEKEAQSPEWKNYFESTRQKTLFDF